MADIDKTKEQLIEELEALRQHVTKLEKLDDERKRVEEALRNAERDWMASFNSLEDVMIIIDKDYNIEKINDSGLALLGKRREEVIGRKCYQVIGDREIPGEDCPCPLAARTKRVESTESHDERFGKYFSIKSSPVFDENGEIIKFVDLLRDITEHKQAEEESENERKRVEQELRESEKKYRDLADLLPQTVFELDEAGNFKFINLNSIEVFAYTLEDSDKGWNVLQMFVPEDRDSVKENIKRVLSGKELGGAEYTALRKDGSTFPIVVYASPIIEENKAVGLRGIAIDITERKRAEAESKQALAELERSNAELQQFANVASHDLQEPLRMVSSFTQLLAKRYQGKLDKDADEFIAYAVDGANRMQRLLNDLLTYSRVTTRGRPFKPTDCEAIFNQAVTNLRVTIEENGAVVTHDPLPTVMADATQLVQLFQNLVGNAIKFRSKEPPCVHVSVKQEGGEWVFSVHDNGIGIAPQYFDRIFVIFQRLHGRRDYPGTGTGLAICKQIVERHNGCIWVESEPGKGSTFYFTIPMTGK